MNTPAGTPTKRKHNISYNSPSFKKNKSQYSNQNLNIFINEGEYSLDPNFKEYLISRIPILTDNILYGLVIEYCLIINNKKKRKVGDISSILNNITVYLTQLKNESIQKINEIRMNIENNRLIEKKHPKTGELFKLFKLSNKIIKTHSITPDALIETFINCILHYCSNIHRIKSVTNTRLNYSTNNKLYQSMNIAPGMELGYFVIILYNSDLPNTEKNKILLSVLKTIATKLKELQDSCGFIHGDLNLGNVFVTFDDEDETALPEITFIDYGYSSVRLPLNSTETLIISSPTEINIVRTKPFDIISEPHLRAIDMYHLIDDLDCINNNDSKINNKKSYTSFKDFINKIKSLYNLMNTKITRQHKKNIREYNSTRQNRRKFTSSPYFKIDDERYKIFIPKNFLEIKLNSNNIIMKKLSVVQETTKKPSMFGINNNNN